MCSGMLRPQCFLRLHTEAALHHSTQSNSCAPHAQHLVIQCTLNRILLMAPHLLTCPPSCLRPHPSQADIESIYLEADQGYCTDIRDEYIRHFLRSEFVTGVYCTASL
jgi:hypothetical protein